MPLATTKKVTETKKVNDLLSTLQTEREFTVEEIDLLSDRAIDFISYQASVEPENRRILGIPSPEKRGNLSRFESAECVKDFLIGSGILRCGLRKVYSGIRYFWNEWVWISGSDVCI